MRKDMDYSGLDTCVYCGKKCFTREQADSVIRMYKKKSRYRKFGKIPTRAYFCYDCGWWHVTSHKIRPKIERRW